MHSIADAAYLSHDLKTVFDAMRYFLENNLMAVESAVFKLTLVPLPFDSHTQNVCGTLKEGDVVLTEIALERLSSPNTPYGEPSP